MRARLIIGWLVLLSLVAAIGYAQQPPAAAQMPAARTMSLAEALDIARRNSPDFRATQNDRWGASTENRSAFFSLFLPSASLSGNRYRTAAGSRQFAPGIPSVTIPGSTTLSWGFDVTYRLSGRTIANRGLASASLRAVDQDVQSALTLLETGVRSGYLTLLQTQAQAGLARRSLERVTENLNLARARYSVGQGTLIDVRRAEVDKGQGEVNVLTAEQAVENEILRLFQRLGVPAPEPLRVELTDSFPVKEPAWVQEQLVSQALAQNPGLLSLRSRQESARWSIRAAKSDFLPSLSFSAGLGGRRSTTDGVPAPSKISDPFSYSISASLPLFEPFSRNVSVQLARAQEDDLAQAIRGRELTVRSEVVAANHAVIAAFRKIDLQRANKAAAAEALDLATQRYRVGSGTYLELLDARVTTDRADADYVTAVYEYHKAIATLENAVGRPLR
jgi:outer membrane protein